MRTVFRNFLVNCQGATAVEYGLIVAILCAALIGGFSAMSDSLNTLFVTIAGYLKG